MYMLKNFNRVILTSLLLLIAGAAKGAYTYGDFDTSNKTCTLTGYQGTGPSGSVTIPSSYVKDGVAYQVTAIASNALNDLPELTQVNLPASIVKIGQLSAEVWGPCYNFYNCPKLKKFAVKAENKVFASTDDGLLVSKKGEYLYRIPSAWAGANSSGRYNVPESFDNFGFDAMVGVTTISSLKFKDTMNIGSFDCFYAMPNLQNIFVYDDPNVDHSGLYHSKNGVLYSATELICCPPKNFTGEFTIPDGIATVDPHAFCNCTGVTGIKFPASIKHLSTSAFAGSGLKKITIPAAVTSIGAYLFAGCESLTSVTFENSFNSVPTHIFDGCKALTSVKFSKEPLYYLSGVFKNCKSLKNYFLSGEMRLEGDSIFAGSGLTKVYYKPGPMSSWNADSHSNGICLFAWCVDMESVDVSNVESTPSNPYKLTPGAFFGCNNISKVVFPDYMSCVLSHKNEWSQYFPINPKANQIAFGCIGSDSRIFCYNDGAVHRPNVYWLADKYSDDYNSCNLVGAFAVDNGASVEPTVYSSVLHPHRMYAFEKATYYVPGGAVANYPDAVRLGNQVEEMFHINAKVVNGNVVFSVKSLIPGRVIMKSYVCGGRSLLNPNEAEFDTQTGVGSATPIFISYYVDNIQMTTTYTAGELLTASAEVVLSDKGVEEAQYFDVTGRQVLHPEKGHLYIVRRGTISAKEIF